MSLENLTDEDCKKEIKAVAGFYTEDEKERDLLYKECLDFFDKKYNSLIKEGKNNTIAKKNSLMETMEHMTYEANKLYSSKRN